LIGEIINGRYRLDRELGQGGMGTVYLAHDAVLDRHVALKLMSKPRLGTEGRSRLLVEARTVARMKHPNIVTVYDAGEVELQPYVVMEYIQGKTLNEYELDGFKGVVQASTQICAALQYAHEQDIIHRDLKPENIIIQPDGSLQLMDFGLAVSTSARMTEKGLIMGTVAYMSPEQAFGYEVSPASDLYSLGVILYELTTGSLPFEAENALGVITQHIHAPVVPPRAKNEQIPIQLNDLILSLLSKNPGDRPGSAAEVANILKDPRVLEAEGTPAREFSVLDRIVRGRIVGRQEEYEEALNLWRNVVAGQGQALLISGEPGIGKTRLVREIVTSAEVSGGWALVGECYAESNAPYNAFAQIIRQVLEHHHQNGLQLPDAVLDDLLDLTPELRYQYPDVIPNPKLDPESEQQRLFENMVALYEGLSNKTPLISVIDDAHWGDSGTLAMLHHLIRRTQHMPVMILATYREIELKEARPFNEMLLDLNRQRQGTRLKLNRLDRQATRELLEAIFAVEVSDEFLDGIYRETDGNPFFIEEVCRTLVESGALYYEDGQWHRPSMDELEIPQGVQVAVESRIAKLPKENQEVLRMASILGREFGFNILLEALDLDEDTTIEAIEAAEEAQMIQEIAGVGEVRFSFVHALVPSAIVESIRTLRRRKLYRRAAMAIEKLSPDDYEALAFHYGEAGDESLALKYYSLAGERAAAAFTNQDAEQHFLSALDLVEDEHEEADLLLKLGFAQADQNKNNEAIETWQQAVELYKQLNEIDEVARLYAQISRAAWNAGDTKGGLEFAREGLALVEGLPDGPGFAYLLAETSRACYFNGLPEDSNEYGTRALEMAKRLNLPEIKIEALSTLALLPQQTPEISIRLLKEAAQLAESSHLPRSATRALNNLSISSFQLFADLPEAKHAMQQAVDIARQVGNREEEMFYLSNIVMYLLLENQIRAAENEESALRNLLKSIPDAGMGAAAFNHFYSILLMEQGNLDQAIEFTLNKLEHERKTGDLQRLEGSLSIIVQISLITDDFEHGKPAAEEMVLLSEKGMASVVEAHSFLSVIFSREGDTHQARVHYLLAAAEMDKTQITYFDKIWIRLAQAELSAAEGKWEEAWVTYEELIRFAAEINFLWNVTLAKLAWISAHLRRGEPEDLKEAKEMLTEALSGFQEMGADGFVELVQEKLNTLN
jgi:predicted ATPase/predicted Ser/Thr protein kinase